MKDISKLSPLERGELLVQLNQQGKTYIECAKIFSCSLEFTNFIRERTFYYTFSITKKTTV